MYTVILAGGAGNRLWPLSRESYPKQYLKLENNGNSLLQEALGRAAAVVDPGQIVVVTHRDQVENVRLQLEEAGFSGITVLAEPRTCNTAPAVALAAWWLHCRGAGEAVMAVLPADHLIPSRDRFVELMEKGRQAGKRYGLVAFGLQPTRPETGFGYIQRGDPLDDTAFAVKRFVEKPPLEEALRLLADGSYLWNSGMFVFRVDALMDQFRRHLPAMARAFDRVEYAALQNLEEIYATLEPVSVDHGILERAGGGIAVIPSKLSWSDVGSWESLFAVLEKDDSGNYFRGRVVSMDTRDSLILARSRLVGAVGLKDLVVVDTSDALLVCSRESAQEVKRVVERLKADGAPEYADHRTVYRPWGRYTLLEEAETYKVKRITVNPGHRLSLQSHRHRREQWVVVQGEALVTVDEREIRLSKGESAQIPAGARHRLANTGKAVLELIEVQNGDYVGEDDIVREADDYGREGKK